MKNQLIAQSRHKNYLKLVISVHIKNRIFYAISIGYFLAHIRKTKNIKIYFFALIGIPAENKFFCVVNYCHKLIRNTIYNGMILR